SEGAFFPFPRRSIPWRSSSIVRRRRRSPSTFARFARNPPRKHRSSWRAKDGASASGAIACGKPWTAATAWLPRAPRSAISSRRPACHAKGASEPRSPFARRATPICRGSASPPSSASTRRHAPRSTRSPRRKSTSRRSRKHYREGVRIGRLRPRLAKRLSFVAKVLWVLAALLFAVGSARYDSPPAFVLLPWGALLVGGLGTMLASWILSLWPNMRERDLAVLPPADRIESAHAQAFGRVELTSRTGDEWIVEMDDEKQARAFVDQLGF